MTNVSAEDKVTLLLHTMASLRNCHVHFEILLYQIAASNLYAHPSGDKEGRRAVFEKYFPDGTFVDYSANFEEDEPEPL